METYLLLEVVVGLVLLISYFLLAKNVSQIRQAVTVDDQTFEHWIKIYKKHIAWHRKSEALNALQEAIWAEYRKEWFGEKSYDALKEKWEPLINELGGEFMVKQKRG
jgi:hypothetical protein